MKKGRIQLLYSGFEVLSGLVSVRGASMSIDAIEDLRLEDPTETSSGVAGGVEAAAGRPKKLPIRICD